MSLLSDNLPGLLSAVGATTVPALAALVCDRLRLHRARTAQRGGAFAPLEGSGCLRRYTLLRTADPDGGLARYTTTRPPGTVITHLINGHPQHFELTDVAVGDGTYAAEPLEGAYDALV